MLKLQNVVMCSVLHILQLIHQLFELMELLKY